jgi:SPP1 gp7 family putative phage head morphogenesis protein
VAEPVAEPDRRAGQRDAAARTLTGLAAAVERVVAEALDDVADAYTASLAAAFDDADTRRVARLWRRRTPRIVAALLRVYEAAVKAVARRFGRPPPPAVDDLPARYADDPDRLPAAVQSYISEASNRLDGVGDALWDTARQALADGVARGEGVDQLRRRLQKVFAEDGVELGKARAERIARTETAAAWNRAAVDQASALPEGVRPLYKTWLATVDERTRPAHWRADGQTVPLVAPFTVDGQPLSYPADPAGTPGNTINCRCTVTFGHDPEPPGDDGRQFLDDNEIAQVVDYFEERGIVRDAHPKPNLSAASGGPYTGGMVALLPSAADVDRLAVPGGELPDDLHLTLLFLGDGADIPDGVRERIVAQVREQVGLLAGDGGVALPVESDGFAISAFNPGSEDRDTAIVLGVGGADLQVVQRGIAHAVADVYDYPEQHAPWVPHVTLTYSDDLGLVAELSDRTGPIVFDRLRVAFGDQVHDIPLALPRDGNREEEPEMAGNGPRRWSTPGDTGIAFESEETGDGRIFAAGALYWEGDQWPLQYAPEMLHGHEGAQLAGAIETIGRDGGRIAASGVLYPDQDAGKAAISLLEQSAPLGVSVDLDDVDIEVLSRRPAEDEDGGGDVVLLASLGRASFTRLADGRWAVRAARVVEWTTSDSGGAVAGDGLRAALTAAGLAAAAGDGDSDDGEVLFSESAGDYVMRVTRARVRGATLVTMPAFANARIVLEHAEGGEGGEVTAACDDRDHPRRMRDVVSYVVTSPVPVRAADVAEALGMVVDTVRGHLRRAVDEGCVVRLGDGRYVAAATLPDTLPEVVAAMSGDVELPIFDDRDARWDGDEAASRVLAWATGGDGQVDADRLGQAFLYRDADRDAATLAAYKLPVADVFDGRLEIVAGAVFAVASVLQGGRGGADIPDDEQEKLRGRVSRLYERLAEKFDDPGLVAPWDRDDGGEEMGELEASAWREMRALPPMPAEWFAEPTEEELPPGSGGVHYRNGRIYGWVAQAGEPHAGMPGRNLTIESLGDIDLTHFLRAEFQLDDGSTVRAGAVTMNVGHHRDGAECETTACQFDDTRTVAGIVTVGMNERGMWFSGAGAPWLSLWDRQVWAACQPSYHMRQGRDGRWQLRAVLTVPVPGHSSPLVAAVTRANAVLAASASPQQQQRRGGVDVAELAAALARQLVGDTTLVDDLAAAVEQRRAELVAARQEAQRLADSLLPARTEIAAVLAAKVKEGV